MKIQEHHSHFGGIIMVLVMITLFGGLLYMNDQLTDYKQAYLELAAQPCPSCVTDCNLCTPQPREELPAVVEEPEVEEEPEIIEEGLTPHGLVPVTTNERGTHISSFRVSPACVFGVTGGEIFYAIDATPKNVSIQVDDGGGYETVFFDDTIPPKSKYLYFAVCGPNDKRDCKWKGDFSLQEGNVYRIRGAFNQSPVFSKLELSNEKIIDTRVGAEYQGLACSSSLV